ncbi:MAG: tetratricopeptide repeat protein [Proteobacteria bacterium]|nr:tetratricopeptide repeat protein [Pseudomonadota bacterium]
MHRLSTVVSTAVVFTPAFALFALMAAPGITWMDPGELAQAAYNLGGAHPPGHPAHSLAGKLVSLLPVGEIAFRLNLFSAAAMAGALAGLFALCHALLGQATAAATAAVALAALSPVLQINAVRTEVYAPCAALVMWALVAVVRFVRAARSADRSATPDGRLLLVAAIGFGLAAAFHPLIAASAATPAAIASLMALWPTRHRLVRLIPPAVALALFGGALYLYLPARANAASPPLLVWGDPAGPDAFAALITGAVYRENFTPQGMLGRLAELLLLTADGAGAGLVWGGLLGLAFAALTGLRGTGVVLASALAIIAGAATQERTNPDMPGYVLPALLFLAAGLAPLCGAILRMLPAVWTATSRQQYVASAVILTPLVGFALLAPTLHSQRFGNSGFQHHDDPLHLWSDTVGRMPPGPGAFFANSDYSLFTAQYERLVAGQRPDIAVVNAALCRDQWFLTHVKNTLPALYVPYIDDGLRGQTAPRLAIENLTRQRAVAGDVPTFVRLDRLVSGRATPMGRGYRYALSSDRPTGSPGSRVPGDGALPPPRFQGPLGRRISERIGLIRGFFELSRGRLAEAARAAGLFERFGQADMTALSSASPARPGLHQYLPIMTAVFISEPWQLDLLGDEIAWVAGLQPDEQNPGAVPADQISTPNTVPERRLHALWRELLMAEKSDSARRDASLLAITELGRDAEIATGQMLAANNHNEFAITWLRQVIVRRGADHKNLLLLGSILGNRGTAEALAEAEGIFVQATEIAPNEAEPWVRLGIVQAKLDKVEQARRSWQRALSVDPGRRDVATLLRNLHVR